MKNDYKGTYHKTPILPKPAFDWTAFIYWIISLLISLVPLYIEFIKYFHNNKHIDIKFWISYFVNGDILWVFSTLLLFVLVDSFTKKRKRKKKWVDRLSLFSIPIFLFTEITWITFYFLDISPHETWPLYLGIPLIVLTLLVCAPLKIEFLKED